MIKPLLGPWRDALLMELRMRDIPGTRIGEILAEVDTHCTDSGEAPEEAFGDPVAYARSFAPPPQKPLARRIASATLPTAATVAGVLALLSGITGLASGEPATVSVGALVSVAAITVVMAAFAAIRRAGATLVLVVVTGMIATVLPQLALRQAAFETSSVALLSVGLVLFALAWWPTQNRRKLPDPVVDPRTGDDVLPVPRYAWALIRWGLPVTLLIALGIIVATT